jgi:hypothetical protein
MVQPRRRVARTACARTPKSDWWAGAVGACGFCLVLELLQALEHLHGLYGIQRAHRHHGLPGYRSRWIRDNYRDAMAHATGILLDPSIAPACASWIGPRARVNVHLRRMLGYYVEWHLCEAGHQFYFHEHDGAAAQQDRTASGRCGRHLAWRSRISPNARHAAAIDGLPVNSFSDLVDHLATITLNRTSPEGVEPNHVVPNPRSSRTRRSNCLASPPQFWRVRAFSR